MQRFGCATRAAFLVIRRARSRHRAKMKASPSGRFKKNKAPEDRPKHLPDADALHIPLVTGDRAEGVLTVRLANPPTMEQRELLDAFAAQLALFVNKERALEESRAAQVAHQSQKLQKTLFDSVSHELKTPLAAMSARFAAAAARPRRVATSRPPSYPHGRSFARRNAFGIGPSSARCGNGANRANWCARRSRCRD